MSLRIALYLTNRTGEDYSTIINSIKKDREGFKVRMFPRIKSQQDFENECKLVWQSHTWTIPRIRERIEAIAQDCGITYKHAGGQYTSGTEPLRDWKDEFEKDLQSIKLVSQVTKILNKHFDYSNAKWSL